ncbi:MAG: BatD family protein [Candidatus Omnitrophica bacterium]|nr:BatD family protein [Candidatus Omnitrophota bacterium]
MRRIAIIFCLVFAGWQWCRAETVDFEISIDQRSVAVGEAVEFGMRFRDTRSMPVLELPASDGFDLHYLGPSTSMTVTNGKVASSITHIYRLLPRKTGSYTIGPLSFEYNGNTYVSNELTIEISASPQTAAESVDEQVMLLIEPEKTEFYLNEKVLLRVKFLTHNIRFELEPPVLEEEGLFMESLGPPRQYQAHIRGLVYNVVEYQYSMFGLREGRLSLGPARMACNMIVRTSSGSRRRGFFSSGFFDDFFGGYERHPMTVSSTEMGISVLPLPGKGRPADFRGAVGSFEIEAEASPVKVQAGDPVTLTMAVSGEGNYNTVTAPQVVSEEGFKVYEPRMETDKGQRLYEQVIMPLSEEITEVPQVSFSFFDPRHKEYRTLVRGPFPLEVTKPLHDERLTFVEPSGLEKASRRDEHLGEDIIFIKSSPGVFSPRGAFLYRDPVFLGVQALPLIGFILGTVLYSRRRRLRSDIRYARHLQAPRKARQGIQRARGYLAAHDTAAFYDALYQTLRGYIGDRFHLPSGGMTAGVVDEALVHTGISAGVLSDLRDLFEECDMARYAPSSLGEKEMCASLRKLEESIDYLQRQKVNL